MAKLEYFVVSESLAIDAQTNRVSIFNVLEHITVAQFPSLLPGFAAIAVWNAERGDAAREARVTFLVYLPGSEEEPRRFDVPLRLPGERGRTLMLNGGETLKGPGELRVEVLLDGAHVASHTVSVAQQVAVH